MAKQYDDVPSLEDDFDLTPPRQISSRAPKATVRGRSYDDAITGNPPGPKSGTDSGEMSGRAAKSRPAPARTSDTKMF